ncbi:hypothetical protein GALMADRAFT_244314 [Galerina marginata CBS 339.88]|uniref:Nephrocystin 3-like N-terminal domain-containing protein n=1 Tax=Galerina marginata (strain CBS 339.88) TaxID=685588 RepID=A0A067T6D7_GALM3|nr:hypothetical protein GALMADRAFT_244314 [Galerina marginata CBS 339.88]
MNSGASRISTISSGEVSTAPSRISISGSVITGGTFTQHNYQVQGAKNGFDRLQEVVAPGAFHDSGERSNPPQHRTENTLAVKKTIMDWVLGQDSKTQHAFILWLHGAMGTGKSVMAQEVAEHTDAQGLLIASFFFSRSDPNRNHGRSLFPTIAYQLALAIPQIREKIATIIENDPLILTRSFSTQFQSLIAAPLQDFVRSDDSVGTDFRRLIVIDGLDECLDHKTQCTILDIILNGVQQHRLPVIFLITSRPEQDIFTKFNSPDMCNVLTCLGLNESFLPTPKLLLNDSDNSDGSSNMESQPQEESASEEFHIYATITYQSFPEEDPGRRWLSVTEGERLYTNGVMRSEVDPQGNRRPCLTARNKAGNVGLIRMGIVVFQPLSDDFLPHMNQACRSTVSLDYGSIPFSKWLPVTKDELLSTDGVVRIEDGVYGSKISCYQVCNRAGRIGFIDASKIIFENETQEPPFDRVIRSKVTFDYSANPRSMWLSVKKGEILHTDGRSRIEVGLDGKRYQCYKVRNDSGKRGLINVGNALFM